MSKAEREKAMRKSTFGMMGALAMALTGCQNAAEPEQDSELGEGAAAAEETPEAGPTQSIFGPEAQLPEPEPSEEPSDAPLIVTIGFPDGGAKLDADAVAALEAALETPAIKSGAPITLGAHSDTGGNDKANIDASEARGLAVAAWLIERGIAEERISVIAFGEQNPIEPNALPDGSTNEAGRAANRRVEMVVDAVVSAQSDEMTSEVGDQS